MAVYTNNGIFVFAKMYISSLKCTTSNRGVEEQFREIAAFSAGLSRSIIYF